MRPNPAHAFDDARRASPKNIHEHCVDLRNPVAVTYCEALGEAIHVTLKQLIAHSAALEAMPGVAADSELRRELQLLRRAIEELDGATGEIRRLRLRGFEDAESWRRRALARLRERWCGTWSELAPGWQDACRLLEVPSADLVRRVRVSR